MKRFAIARAWIIVNGFVIMSNIKMALHTLISHLRVIKFVLFYLTLLTRHNKALSSDVFEARQILYSPFLKALNNATIKKLDISHILLGNSIIALMANSSRFLM
jgi:hypothetical protein